MISIKVWLLLQLICSTVLRWNWTWLSVLRLFTGRLQRSLLLIAVETQFQSIEYLALIFILNNWFDCYDHFLCYWNCCQFWTDVDWLCVGQLWTDWGQLISCCKLVLNFNFIDESKLNLLVSSHNWVTALLKWQIWLMIARRRHC